MSLLTRYMVRQNIFLMLTVLGVGTGIYLLSDLFDRLDDFLEAGLSFYTIATYFIVKMPLIISQILPAVFLLACIIQLCVMARSRELVALQAGGISFARLARFIVVYGLIWSIAQLAFSQYLGAMGEKEASRIWKYEVRGKTIRKAQLQNVWFTEGPYVVYLGSVIPEEHKASTARVYTLGADGKTISTVLVAKEVFAQPGNWIFSGVQQLEPGKFTSGRMANVSLPLKQDIKAFLVIDPRSDPQRLPLWKLHEAISRLKATGSNVEALRTAWHSKLAYASAVIVMGLVALMLITWCDSLYINVGLGLLLTFAFYAIFTVGGSMGQKGIVSPLVGAWGANMLFGGLALARIIWFTRSRA